jgi:hypothetical protein
MASTYLYLTPRSKFLFDKLIVAQLVRKLPAFHGSRIFITVFAKARHEFPSWARWIQSSPFYPMSCKTRFKISLCPRLLLGHAKWLLPSGLYKHSWYVSPFILCCQLRQISRQGEWLTKWPIRVRFPTGQKHSSLPSLGANGRKAAGAWGCYYLLRWLEIKNTFGCSSVPLQVLDLGTNYHITVTVTAAVTVTVRPLKSLKMPHGKYSSSDVNKIEKSSRWWTL